jgi:hypothetical protein
MLTIRIKNDGTGTPEIGNYDFEVLVNNGIIDFGHVNGHKRSEGWQELVRMIANYDSFDQLIVDLHKMQEDEKLRESAESMREEYLTNPDLNMDFCYGCDVKNNPKCDKCVGS